MSTANPLVPSVNASGPERDARDAQLARAREQYQYDFSWAGVCATKKLPREEDFSLEYLARGFEISTALSANRAASTAKGALAHGQDAIAKHRALFSTIPAPLVVDHWREDWLFAWQRLAGPAPVWLRQLTAHERPLDAVTDEDLSRALRTSSRVSDALSRGSLFVADYRLFEGVACGSTDGLAKHLDAPIALFVSDPTAKGGIVPVAIQRAGRARDALYTPADADWALAKFSAQVADENLQGVLLHMGYCHEVLQRFILAMHRQLSERHPLHVLLRGHSDFTLQVNHVARTSVLEAGGVQDRLLAPELSSQLSILVEGVKQLDVESLDPTVEFARRGVDSTETLPLYPFRDDGLLIWRSTLDFVRDYVALYYASDEDVAQDRELAAFVREVGAQDGGRLPRMFATRSVRTIDGLVNTVASILFRATTFHAAINNSNYDWAGFAPNAATAAFAAMPARGTAKESDLAAMWPNEKLALETIAATWQVSQIALNRLGFYRDGHFVDPRVAPVVQRWQRALVSIEKTVIDRNARRPLAYTYLLPSKITASINA